MVHGLSLAPCAGCQILATRHFEQIRLRMKNSTRWHVLVRELATAGARQGPQRCRRQRSSRIIRVNQGSGHACILLFIDIASRSVHVAGITPHPDSSWMTQLARNGRESLGYAIATVDEPLSPGAKSSRTWKPFAAAPVADMGELHDLVKRPPATSRNAELQSIARQLESVLRSS